MRFTCKDPVNPAIIGAEWKIEAIANVLVAKVGTIPNYNIRWDRQEIELPQKLK